MTVVAGRRAQRLEEQRVKRESRRRISVLGVAGEILITGGVVILAFIGWQLLINDRVVASAQKAEAIVLGEKWSKGETPTPAPASPERPDPGDPLIAAVPPNAERFARLFVPRFGADYIRPVAEGVGLADVLNRHGIGHYPGTAMPGEVGNAAFAAHRTGWGASFFDIDKLMVGDGLYFETADGWYRYLVRSLEYVPATGVGVIDPVPQSAGGVPTDRLITLTSCNPVYTADERIIVYGLYDTWFPRAGGAPPEIAALAAQSQGAGPALSLGQPQGAGQVQS